MILSSSSCCNGNATIQTFFLTFVAFAIHVSVSVSAVFFPHNVVVTAKLMNHLIVLKVFIAACRGGTLSHKPLAGKCTNLYINWNIIYITHLAKRGAMSFFANCNWANQQSFGCANMNSSHFILVFVLFRFGEEDEK